MEDKMYGSCIGGVGNFSHGCMSDGQEREYTVVQSLWTKAVKDNECLSKMMYLMGLSLAFAHRSGYRVHMHTDRVGIELLRDFGYEELLPTLDEIPNTVPPELFAAGKFFAMRAEGMVGKVHIDNDVFLKKPGVLDKFYKDHNVDVICQMEEDMSVVNHDHIIKHMHIIGYPATTRPNWLGSMNTGVVGFNNPVLAKKYISNYFDALEMYTQERFEEYKKLSPNADLSFDFVLEQRNLSYMSVGYNVHTLLPMRGVSIQEVADEIGFQHLWGRSKWDYILKIRHLLVKLDPSLYHRVQKASTQAKRTKLRT